MKKISYVTLILGLALGLLFTNVSANSMMNGTMNASSSISNNGASPEMMAAPSAMPDNTSIGCALTGFAYTIPFGQAIFCAGNPGDTIQANLFNDTAASYLWSTGATTQSIYVTVTNNYIVTITDIHGCTGTLNASATVNQPPPAPVIDSAAGTTACNKRLYADVPAFSYLWSNGATTDTILATSGIYTLTISTAQGCTSTSTHHVVIAGGPVATISANGPLTFCAGGNVILTAHGGGTYHWDNNSTVAARTVNAAGTYTVTVTLNGCTATANVIVTVANPPVVNITPNGNVTVCNGSSVNLSTNNNGGGALYHWSTGATTRPITVTPTATTTYTVTVTNVAGCTGTATKTVTVSALPVPVINAAAPTQCYRTLSTTQNFTNYLWSNGANTTTVNATSGVWTVTVTNAAGCTGTATITVTIANAPAPVITFPGNDSICAGTTKVLSLSAAFSTYHWSQNNANTATITVNATGLYRVTVTRANGCTAVAQQQITVITVAPTIVRIPANGPVCSADLLRLRVPIPNNTAPYTTYHWSLNNLATDTITFTATGTYRVTVTNYLGCTGTATINETVNASPAVPVITVTSPTNCSKLLTTTNNYSTYNWTGGGNTNTKAALASGTYTVTVSNAAGCTRTNSSTVVVTAGPTPTIVPSGPTVFCLGDSVHLSTSTTYNAYLWSNAATTATITALVTGNYAVTVTNGQGCTGVATIQVTVNGNVIPTVTPANPINVCAGATVTLTLTNANNFQSHLWSNNSTANAITVTTNGTYSVTTWSGAGCTHTVNRTVTFYPLPTPTITANGPLTFCTGGSVVLSTQAFSTYHWSQGNATTQSITVTTAGTYRVTVTTAQGCTGTVQVIVTVNTIVLPTITPAGPTTICGGGSVTLSTQNYTGYNWLPNGQTTQTVTLSPTVTTAYTLIVTNATGCTATATRIVNVSPAATATITPSGPTSFCTGGNVTLVANLSTSYHWSTNATTQSILVTTAGNYIVTITNAAGCTATASQLVTIGGNLTVTITPSGPTALCSGNSVNLDAGPYTSFIWSNAATSQIINVNTAGTYTVTATQSVGCTGTASVTITVNPNPTPTITANGPTAFCSGGSVLLDAGVYASYTWSNAATSETVSATANTTYTVTVTDNNGCHGLASQVVTVNTSPTPIIIPTGPTNFCAGGSVTLVSTVATSYSWSTGATSQTITVNTGGTYVVTVSDAIGCTGTTSQVVTVSAALNPTITTNSPTSFCNGGNVVLHLSGFTSYAWSTTATTDSITVTTSGTYSVTVTSGSGCTGTTSQVVNVFNIPAPVLTATGPTIFCVGGSVSIDAGVYASYTWSSTETVQAITVTTSGLYSVTITDANGCTASATQSVTVNANPTNTITPSGNTTFCQGGSVTLDAGGSTSFAWSNAATSQSVSATTSGIYAVTVTDINGCTVTASQTVTVNTLPTPTISPNGPTSFCPGGTVALDAGTYPSYSWSTTETTQAINVNTSATITVSVTDANGCVGTASQAVVVFPAPTPTISASGPTTFCSGDSVTLVVGLYVSYNWSTTGTDAAITVTTSGTYSVTINDVNGCVGTASTTVTVNPTPNATITPSGPTTFCTGSSVSLSATASTSYAWSTGETTQAITANATNTYIVTITNANGCTGTASQDVTENSIPVVSISSSSGSDTLCSGFSTDLDAGGYTSYVWSNAGTNETITVNTAGTYTVTVHNLNGCTGTTSATITVNPLPTVSFTFAIDTICINHAVITLSGGSPSNGSYTGAGVTGTSFDPSIATVGNDTLRYFFTDLTTGCTNFAEHVIYVSSCTGVNDFTNGHYVTVYPNPNGGNFTISYNVAAQLTAMRIVDMTGRVVYTQTLAGLTGKATVNAASLSPGIYYYEVISNDNITAQGKMVITK